MKKIWMSCTICLLALVLVFTSQTEIVAAKNVGNYSVSTYIKGKRNNHWTKAIEANSKHTIYVVVNNKNKFNIGFYIKDTKTNKFVKFGGKDDKGQVKIKLTNVRSTYKLRLACTDNYFHDNSKKCNATATMYNYKPKGF
jgi:hypothetical protein